MDDCAQGSELKVRSRKPVHISDWYAAVDCDGIIWGTGDGIFEVRADAKQSFAEEEVDNIDVDDLDLRRITHYQAELIITHGIVEWAKLIERSSP